MGVILETQLDVYEHSLERAGELPLEQLEEAISVGVALFETLAEEVQAFNARPLSGTREQWLNDARAYHARYERLAARLQKLHGDAEAFRQRGLPVRGVVKLDKARSELRTILAFSPDRLEASYRSIQAGNLIPLSKLRDEVQRRLLARSGS